jgi:hypothetical protein
MSLYVMVPISTEVIESNPDCAFSSAYEEGALIVTVDTRCQNVHQRLGLCTKTPLHWGAENSPWRCKSSALLRGRAATGC